MHARKFIPLLMRTLITHLRRDAGYYHTTFSAAVTFTRQFSQTELESHVKTAMIRLRHLVPSFAFKSTKLPSFEFQLSYRVPQSVSDVEAWANEILFFSKTSNDLGRFGSHDRVANERWWKARDNRYTHEIHVAPTSGTIASSQSWTFS